MGMMMVLASVAGQDFRSAFQGSDLVEVEDLPGVVATVDVGKMWQALSLLTTPADGSVAERVEAAHALDPVMGGEEIGEDTGYGPARVHDPAAVASVHAHLSARTDDDLRARFDAPAFAEADVYPFCWDEDPDELWDEELSTSLGEIRTLYADAASAGHSVVMQLL